LVLIAASPLSTQIIQQASERLERPENSHFYFISKLFVSLAAKPRKCSSTTRQINNKKDLEKELASGRTGSSNY
jgi:hypothetical protein